MAKLSIEPEYFYEQDTSGASVLSAVILIAALLILGFLFLRNGLALNQTTVSTSVADHSASPAPYTPVRMQ